MTIEVMTMQTMVMRVLVIGNMTIEVMSMQNMVMGFVSIVGFKNMTIEVMTI